MTPSPDGPVRRMIDAHRRLLATSLFATVPEDEAGRTVIDDRYARSVRTWTALAEGYRMAALTLLQRIRDEPSDFDFLVGPFVFNYRMAVELHLKQMAMLAEIQFEKHHRLTALWDRIGAQSPVRSDLSGDVRARLVELERIDPTSTTFRYSPEAAPQGEFTFGLHHMAQVLDCLIDEVAGLSTALREGDRGRQ